VQVPEAEYEETVNKAAALGRAIDLAEQAFLQTWANRVLYMQVDLITNKGHSVKALEIWWPLETQDHWLGVPSLMSDQSMLWMTWRHRHTFAQM
jgi:hypothetical protein